MTFHRTALLEVLDGVFTAADDKQVTVLIGLDLSAAFDTVDHRLLLDRPRLEFGVTEIPLRWLQSYLSSSRWAGTNHTPLKSTWASRKGLCLALCCLQSTAAQSPPITENVRNMLMYICAKFGACITKCTKGLLCCPTMWPELVLDNGRPRHPQSQGSLEHSNGDIKLQLMAWMRDNVEAPLWQPVVFCFVLLFYRLLWF